MRISRDVLPVFSIVPADQEAIMFVLPMEGILTPRGKQVIFDNEIRAVDEIELRLEALCRRFAFPKKDFVS
jgi:hypothetical protein